MYRFPLASNAIPEGDSICPLTAESPSPEYPWPKLLLPAKVEIWPPVVTIRTTQFSVSAMYKLALLSTATPDGAFNSAFRAAAPSPLYPAVPSPASVLIVLLVMKRTRWFTWSAIYKLPPEIVIPKGKNISPLVGDPPSPAYPAVAFPA